VSQASRFERSSPRCSWAESCEVVAIASRKLAKARAAAEQFGISNAHGFYEELLADPNVEAVFNPLPNHLHVPWSIQAARAGKHVLCEKPISLGADEARADRGERCGGCQGRRGIHGADSRPVASRAGIHLIRTDRRIARGVHAVQLLQPRSRGHPQPGAEWRRRTSRYRLLRHRPVALRVRRGALRAIGHN
jgi:hypothetical protein